MKNSSLSAMKVQISKIKDFFNLFYEMPSWLLISLFFHSLKPYPCDWWNRRRKRMSTCFEFVSSLLSPSISRTLFTLTSSSTPNSAREINSQIENYKITLKKGRRTLRRIRVVYSCTVLDHNPIKKQSEVWLINFLFLLIKKEYSSIPRPVLVKQSGCTRTQCFCQQPKCWSKTGKSKSYRTSSDPIEDRRAWKCRASNSSSSWKSCWW